MRCAESCFRRCPDFAATEVQIAGVLHEYSTIEGVQEDVVDILLNLKGRSAQASQPGGRAAQSEEEGRGPVTAGDIEATHDVEITQP